MESGNADVISYKTAGEGGQEGFTAEIVGLPETVPWNDGSPLQIAFFPKEMMLDRSVVEDLIPDLMVDHKFDVMFESLAKDESELGADSETDTESLANKLARLRQDCNEFEQGLLDAVVQPDDIKITFDDIRADPGAIRGLRLLTTMALLHPEAFKYGVLSREKITGILLHGPPGTGKTMLAKAVAKDANVVLLNVSGADFQSKWLGESQKLVRAVFSLAKKLDPCVIFVDEADSVFATRKANDDVYRRELISQFLLEWDGVSATNKGGFVMAATNRIADIDPAILRRLPRQIFIGNPSLEDREAILRIHLKDERLAEDADLATVARRTVGKSGSDLKTICFAAAMAAVYELLCDSGEIEDLNMKKDEGKLTPKKKTGKRRRRLPKRTICWRHLEQALSEIHGQSLHTSNSKNSGDEVDMDPVTLATLKKFGKQYQEAT